MEMKCNGYVIHETQNWFVIKLNNIKVKIVESFIPAYDEHIQNGAGKEVGG